MADIGLFYAACIWGATFFLVKGALTDIDPVTLVAYRFLLAGTILFVYLVIKRRPVFEGFGRALFLSFILWVEYISQTVGLRFTTASNSGFITGLFVAFIPIFLRFIFNHTPTLFEWFASIVALAGLWVLTGGLQQVNIGDLLTLAAAVTYALHVLYSDKYMKGGVDPIMISCQQFLLVGLMSLATALILNLPLGVRTLSAGGVVLFLALFPTLSAFVIQMFAQRMTSPVKVSMIFAFEPVFAALFAWTLGGETFTRNSIFGGLLIFAALILAGLRSKQQEHLTVNNGGVN